MNKKIRNILILVSVIIILVLAVWYTWPRIAGTPFCFNFVYDTQFGDRQVANPSNQGFGGPGGIMYYIPETPALQTALEKEGFFVDEYEKTGGGVYAGAFFGPSTRAAVMAFQKANGLAQSGEVNNDTIDKLAPKYKCKEIEKTGTSTDGVLGTTTPKNKF